MPKIQVYKHDGVMIPIDLAKTAKAYSCPWTNRIFSTKHVYVSHLTKLRKERMHHNARDKRWRKLGEDLHSQSSFEKIIQWCELHPEWFLDNAKRRDWPDRRKYYEKIRQDFCFQITYLDLRWSDLVSNSHSSPLNGVTNWGSEDDLPKGYPGWAGRIEWKCSHDLPCFGSNIVDGTGIHIGTGGGTGGNRYGFSVRFFADDWPGLGKSVVLDRLVNQKPKSFLYGKPYYFK